MDYSREQLLSKLDQKPGFITNVLPAPEIFFTPKNHKLSILEIAKSGDVHAANYIKKAISSVNAEPEIIMADAIEFFYYAMMVGTHANELFLEVLTILSEHITLQQES